MSTTSATCQPSIHGVPNINYQTSNNMVSGLKNEYNEGLAPPPSLGNHPGVVDLSSSSSSPSPELVPSGLPHFFTQSKSSPLPRFDYSSGSSSSGMNSVNWAPQRQSPQTDISSGLHGHDHPHQTPRDTMPSSNPFQPIKQVQAKAHSSLQGHSVDRRQVHSPVQSGQSISQSSAQTLVSYSNNENANPGEVSMSGDAETVTKGGLNNRRQKRLERNRESARLSRRRRKQYLEVLEERVKSLSIEMDRGRRQHVAECVDILQQLKRQSLQDPSANLLHVENIAACRELRVAATFLTQQLSSLSVAPHIKFLLWLSMQNDAFFRGGRASSERLSAARIGERMLSSGNDRVPPAHGMWPLFCNEVGLSYDQEERVRAFQKALLLSNEGWLQRHSAASSTLLIQSIHDAGQSLAHVVGQRQYSIVHNCLTTDQKRAFLAWADQNVPRIIKSSKGTKSTALIDGNDGYKLSPGHHDAANMYILNHRFRSIADSLAKPDILVNKVTLRRFSRRPSFESLGSCMAMEKKEEEGLSREGSFASSGSLKRSASELSVADEERVQVHCIPPEEAEASAKPTIEAALGFIKELIPNPPSPPVVASPVAQPVFNMPPPPPKSHHHYAPVVVVSQQQAPMQASIVNNNQTIFGSHSSNLMPSQYTSQQVMSQQPFPPATVHQHPLQNGQHQYQSQPVYVSQSASSQYSAMPTFLPPHLNAVPEDGFLSSVPGAEDFLLDLAGEDWAIGEGFDDLNLIQ